MRVLIAGVQGWLGRFTAAALLRQPEVEVLGVGRSPPSPGFSHPLPNGNLAPLPRGLAAEAGAYRYERCDLRDSERLQRLLAAFAPSHVLHLAGAVSGSDAEALHDLNLVATEALMNTVADLEPRPRIIMASTGSVYGEPAYLPQDEDHPLNPVIDYARSKWQAEQVAASVAAARGLTILFARIFNLIGPGAPTSLLPGSLALQLAAVALAQQGPKIRMGPLTTIRDYVDVRDCAEALRRLCSLEFVGISVVNIASGRGTPISEVWDRLRRIALQRGGPPVDIESLPAFPANVSAYVGGTRRLQALGIECATPLQQSLEDLYDWALAALKPDDEDAVASR